MTREMDASVVTVILIFLFFAVQHSLAISDLFKTWVTRRLGEAFYHAYFRLLYTIANSVILVVLFFYLRQLPNPRFNTFSVWEVIGMRAVQCLGIWIFFQAGKRVDLLDFVGIRQAAHYKTGRKGVAGNALIRDGIYGRVRHPLYLGSILVLWGEPFLVSTRNGLALAVLSTLYFYFGSMLEERRMVRQFGEAYRRYQKEVPRLFPFRL